MSNCFCFISGSGDLDATVNNDPAMLSFSRKSSSCSVKPSQPLRSRPLSGSLIIVVSLVAFCIAVATPGASIGTAGFFVLLMLASYLCRQQQALTLPSSSSHYNSPLVSPLFPQLAFKLLVPLIVYFLITLLVRSSARPFVAAAG